MARNRYKIARRSIWYVLRTLIIVAGVVALCLALFAEGMHVSNLYILVTEGMEARSEIIIKGGEPLELATYFTEDFIGNDAALYRREYEGFTVASFDYRVDIKSFFVLPWSARATMVIDDKLAAINAAANETDEDETPPTLPEWTPGRYQVIFTKVGSRWYISGLVLLEINPETEVKPTPDLSLLTPAPSATYAPVPSASPSRTAGATPTP
ncbi:MAG TPA: hypothetical protein VN540_01405 [Clostridia bacterium]|nr:hypothetical protein [Clostridia bacterium]